ncbi:MAG: ATP-binding protein [Ruminococcus sp.]|nr:ATP-binding protein [Ruminococcus sp.]
MPYSQEIYHIAKDRLSERRRQALRAADYRREQLYLEIPALREINNELMSIGAAVAKSVVRNDNQHSIKELSERSLALQAEQNTILAENHIDKDIFEPKFTCEKCEDTGYIERDNRTEVCDCFLKLMADIAGEQLSANLPLNENTFKNFKLDYYSTEQDINGKIPFNRMSNIYNYCVSYADNFGIHSKSLLLRGGTGLGKTHLSLAIANEVIKKGFSVIYVSAPEICNKLEKEHFSHQYNDQEDTFNSLLKCDLLILDDLGTEFVSPFTVSCIYNIFNSRVLANKPTIISTNMQLNELVTTYSQRFVSRLIGSCDRLDFIGDDIRTQIK